jgi:hypothetical protein
MQDGCEDREEENVGLAGEKALPAFPPKKLSGSENPSSTDFGLAEHRHLILPARLSNKITS